MVFNLFYFKKTYKSIVELNHSYIEIGNRGTDSGLN